MTFNCFPVNFDIGEQPKFATKYPLSAFDRLIKLFILGKTFSSLNIIFANTGNNFTQHWSERSKTKHTRFNFIMDIIMQFNSILFRLFQCEGELFFLQSEIKLDVSERWLSGSESGKLDFHFSVRKLTLRCWHTELRYMGRGAGWGRDGYLAVPVLETKTKTTFVVRTNLGNWKGHFCQFSTFCCSFFQGQVWEGLEAVCCKSGKLFNSADFGTGVLIELKMEIVFYRPRGWYWI